MSDKQRKPSLAEGSVSRNEDGAFRGAEGHIGLNHTDGGTNVQAVNVGGGFGWGGDDGLYGARANATLAGAQHDPAAAGESGRVASGGGSGPWMRGSGFITTPARAAESSATERTSSAVRWAIAR